MKAREFQHFDSTPLTLDAVIAAFGENFLSPAERIALSRSPSDATPILRQAFLRMTVANERKAWQKVLGKWVLYPHPSGISLWLRLGDSVSISILLSSKDDRALKFILSKLSLGGSFFDLGANVGWFTLRVAKAYQGMGGGKVFSFEPQQELSTYLQRSACQNRLQDFVNVHQVALGAEPGRVWMRAPGSNSGGSFVMFNPADTEANEMVQMRRFDDIAPEVNRVDCMKVDIEGAEPLFVAGASNFIARHRPIIYSEVHHGRLPIVAKTDRAGYIDQVERLGYRTLVLRSDGSTAPFSRDALADERRLLNVVFEPVA